VSNVCLRKVTFEELSSIQHEVFVSDDAASPTFLVVRYRGTYKIGAAGRGDALYIVAAAEAAQKAWWAPCTVLDLRELEYQWGDEMEWITSIGWDRGTRLHAPLAILVGERCRPALKSLLEESFERYCVDTMEEAFAHCRKQEIEWRRQLKDFRQEPR
jgi:hypothetical protein